MTLDIESLETSFDLVAGRGEELVADFYERRFATAPAVRPLFAGTDPVVGQVLIASMAAVAGDAWRDEHTRAWADAFGVIASAMMEGAATVALPEAA
jgi:hemoglobin-like flavoprotein